MEDNKKGNGGTIGAALGMVAGALATVLSDPFGKWAVFTAQDEAGLKVHHFFEDLFKNRDVGDTAYRIFNAVTNAIMANPFILPMAGGLIASGIGAIIGRKISKAKLKHQSLKTNEKVYHK